MKLNKNLLLKTAFYCVLSLTSVYATETDGSLTTVTASATSISVYQKSADFFYFVPVGGVDSFFKIIDQTKNEILKRLLDETQWSEELNKNNYIKARVEYNINFFEDQIESPNYVPPIPSAPTEFSDTEFSDMDIISALYGIIIDIYSRTGPTAPWTRIAHVNPLKMIGLPVSIAYENGSYHGLFQKKSDDPEDQNFLRRTHHPQAHRLAQKMGLTQIELPELIPDIAARINFVGFPQKSDDELQTDAIALWSKAQEFGSNISFEDFMTQPIIDDFLIDILSGSGCSFEYFQAMQRAYKRARQSAAPSLAPRVNEQKARLLEIFARVFPTASKNLQSTDSNLRREAMPRFECFLIDMEDSDFTGGLRQRYGITETHAELLAMRAAFKPTTKVELFEFMGADSNGKLNQHNLNQQLQNADPRLKKHLENLGFIYTDAGMRALGQVTSEQRQRQIYNLFIPDQVKKSFESFKEEIRKELNLREHVIRVLSLSETHEELLTLFGGAPAAGSAHSNDELVFDHDPKVVAYEEAEEKVSHIQGILGFTGDILPLLRDPTQIYLNEQTFGDYLRDLLGEIQEYTDAKLKALAEIIDEDRTVE